MLAHAKGRRHVRQGLDRGPKQPDRSTPNIGRHSEGASPSNVPNTFKQGFVIYQRLPRHGRKKKRARDAKGAHQNTGGRKFGYLQPPYVLQVFDAIQCRRSILRATSLDHHAPRDPVAISRGYEGRDEDANTEMKNSFGVLPHRSMARGPHDCGPSLVSAGFAAFNDFTRLKCHCSRPGLRNERANTRRGTCGGFEIQICGTLRRQPARSFAVDQKSKDFWRGAGRRGAGRPRSTSRSRGSSCAATWTSASGWATAC